MSNFIIPIQSDNPDANLKYCDFKFDSTNNRWFCSVCENSISTKLVGNIPPHSICRKSPILYTTNRKNFYEPPKNGVGSELKKILSSVGIKATPNCSCNTKAKIMDNNGIKWCEDNIDTIVGWLREEANKRKIPFIDMAGKILVKKAIRNAKKNQ